MTFLKLEQFMKILYPDSISGYPDIRILYPDIRILYPKLVCFGYHFLENLPDDDFKKTPVHMRVLNNLNCFFAMGLHKCYHDCLIPHWFTVQFNPQQPLEHSRQ